MYSYNTKDVNIINSYLQKFSGLTAKADIYDINGALKYSNTVTTSVDGDGIRKCFAIPPLTGLSNVYFLRLSLKDSKQETKSINWYWLSQKPDQLMWKKSKWFYTPQSQFTDLTGLKDMPSTTLSVNHSASKKENETIHSVTITNTGKAVAFFVHMRVLREKNADDILPVIFSDNYISLAPGESRTIECSYDNKDAGNNTPYILITGWNLNIGGSKASGNSGFEK